MPRCGRRYRRRLAGFYLRTRIGTSAERSIFRASGEGALRPMGTSHRPRHRDCAPNGTTPVAESVDVYRTAPRGATSTAATPLAYSTTSRSPCWQRSTPESSANVETTWSITSSSLLASRSSYVTSILSPLMSRTRSTMPSMIPHTRRASPPLCGNSGRYRFRSSDPVNAGAREAAEDCGHERSYRALNRMAASHPGSNQGMSGLQRARSQNDGWCAGWGSAKRSRVGAWRVLGWVWGSGSLTHRLREEFTTTRRGGLGEH